MLTVRFQEQLLVELKRQHIADAPRLHRDLVAHVRFSPAISASFESSAAATTRHPVIDIDFSATTLANLSTAGAPGGGGLPDRVAIAVCEALLRLAPVIFADHMKRLASMGDTAAASTVPNAAVYGNWNLSFRFQGVTDAALQPFNLLVGGFPLLSALDLRDTRVSAHARRQLADVLQSKGGGGSSGLRLLLWDDPPVGTTHLAGGELPPPPPPVATAPGDSKVARVLVVPTTRPAVARPATGGIIGSHHRLQQCQQSVQLPASLVDLVALRRRRDQLFHDESEGGDRRNPPLPDERGIAERHEVAETAAPPTVAATPHSPPREREPPGQGASQTHPPASQPSLPSSAVTTSPLPATSRAAAASPLGAVAPAAMSLVPPSTPPLQPRHPSSATHRPVSDEPSAAANAAGRAAGGRDRTRTVIYRGAAPGSVPSASTRQEENSKTNQRTDDDGDEDSDSTSDAQGDEAEEDDHARSPVREGAAKHPGTPDRKKNDSAAEGGSPSTTHHDDRHADNDKAPKRSAVGASARRTAPTTRGATLREQHSRSRSSTPPPLLKEATPSARRPASAKKSRNTAGKGPETSPAGANGAEEPSRVAVPGGSAGRRRSTPSPPAASLTREAVARASNSEAAAAGEAGGTAAHDDAATNASTDTTATEVADIQDYLDVCQNASENIDKVIDFCNARLTRDSMFNPIALRNVTILNIAQNALTELAPLPPTLRRLDASHNNLTHISGLDDCLMLQVATFRRNNIKRIAGLHHNLHVTHLFLGRNAIRTVENIAHLVILETLDLAHNQLPSENSLRPLSMNVRLLHIVVSGNPVEKKLRHYSAVLRNLCPSLVALDNQRLTMQVSRGQSLRGGDVSHIDKAMAEAYASACRSIRSASSKRMAGAGGAAAQEESQVLLSLASAGTATRRSRKPAIAVRTATTGYSAPDRLARSLQALTEQAAFETAVAAVATGGGGSAAMGISDKATTLNASAIVHAAVFGSGRSSQPTVKNMVFSAEPNALEEQSLLCAARNRQVLGLLDPQRLVPYYSDPGSSSSPPRHPRTGSNVASVYAASRHGEASQQGLAPEGQRGAPPSALHDRTRSHESSVSAGRSRIGAASPTPSLRQRQHDSRPHSHRKIENVGGVNGHGGVRRAALLERIKRESMEYTAKAIVQDLQRRAEKRQQQENEDDEIARRRQAEADGGNPTDGEHANDGGGGGPTRDAAHGATSGSSSPGDDENFVDSFRSRRTRSDASSVEPAARRKDASPLLASRIDHAWDDAGSPVTATAARDDARTAAMLLHLSPTAFDDDKPAAPPPRPHAMPPPGSPGVDPYLVVLRASSPYHMAAGGAAPSGPPHILSPLPGGHDEAPSAPVNPLQTSSKRRSTSQHKGSGGRLTPSAKMGGSGKAPAMTLVADNVAPARRIDEPTTPPPRSANAAAPTPSRLVSALVSFPPVSGDRASTVEFLTKLAEMHQSVRVALRTALSILLDGSERTGELPATPGNNGGATIDDDVRRLLARCLDVIRRNHLADDIAIDEDTARDLALIEAPTDDGGPEEGNIHRPGENADAVTQLDAEQRKRQRHDRRDVLMPVLQDVSDRKTCLRYLRSLFDARRFDLLVAYARKIRHHVAPSSVPSSYTAPGSALPSYAVPSPSAGRGAYGGSAARLLPPSFT